MAKLEELENSRVKLTIEVSADQFEHGLDHAYEQIKKDVEVKGFRKGEVPRKVYEQQNGVESLYEEALNHVIQETYTDAVMEHNLAVVSQPKIDLDINAIEKGKPFTYTATVAVKPEVTLGQYKDLEYERPSDEVNEEEVQDEIKKLQDQNAELVVKEDGEVEEGDTAVIDFEGFVDGEAFEGGKAENHELEIGSNSFIPGFEEQLIGMKPGEEKDVKVTFPENYQAENLAGKEATFKVKLHEIKQKVTPELNDEFVQDLDKEGIESVEELKADTRKTLEAQKQETNKNKAVDFAVDTASKNAEMTIADEMIEEEKNRLMDNTKKQAQQYGLDLDTYLQLTGMSKEQFEERLKEDAERSIRYNLTIDQVAKEEGIDATDEEVEQKYQELADQHNMDVEQVKNQVNENAVKQEVVFKKAIDFLVDNLKDKKSE
ncbi:MAG: trigger factor [Bacillota bacterium]